MSRSPSSSRWGGRARTARVRAADRLRELLLGPVAADPVGWSIRSVREHSWRPEVAAHLIALHPLHPPVIERYPEPAGFGPGFRSVKAFDERSIIELGDVVVGPVSGIVRLPGGPVLEESVGSLRRLVGWADARPELLAGVRPLRGRGERPLVPCPPLPYYHWLLEVLPGLVSALRAVPDAEVLLPAAVPAYVRSGLAWLRDAGLLHHEPRVADRPVRAPRVVLPAVEPFSGFVHPEDRRALREQLLPVALRGGQPAGERPVRYVSRRRARDRPLAGEPALEAHLAAAGVEVVLLEGMDLQAQARLFAGSAAVIGPHGAGLANAVWARSGTAVVEIFPHGFRNDCYARLAPAVGVSYRCVEAGPGGAVDAAAVQAALAAVHPDHRG